MRSMAVAGFVLLLTWLGWGRWEFNRQRDEYQRLGRTLAVLAEPAAALGQKGWEVPNLDSYPDLVSVALLDGSGVELTRQNLNASGPAEELSFPVVPRGSLVLRWSTARLQAEQGYVLQWLLGLIVLSVAATRAKATRKETKLTEVAAAESPLLREAVLELDKDMKILSVRSGNSQLTGYEPGDLVGKPLSFLMDDQDCSLESLSHNTLVKTKGGSRVSSQMSTAVVESASGEVERVIVVLKSTDSASGLYRQRIQELEQQYRGLCDQASDLVVVLQSDGQVFYANRAAVTLSGYSLEQMMGKPIWEMLEGNGDLRLLFHRALAGEKLPTLENYLRCKDGRKIPVEGGFSAVQANGALGVMGIFRDLSERRRTEEILRKSEDRLRQAQKMEAIGRLAGGIAHDFNNLLTVIRAVMELLPPLPDDQELFDELEHAVSRATALTGQLLLFCRQKVLQPTVLSVDEVIHGVLNMARRVLGEDIALTSELQSPDQILCDGGELEQLLMNLFVNARDAMPRGGELRVESRSVDLPAMETLSGPIPPGRYVHLKVSDTGTGIPAEVLPSIFEPYFTTKGVGEGTGLGLSTVYAVVQRLGGGLGVSSQVGQGTTFEIYLPTTSAKASTGSVRPKGDSRRGSGELVLLVEDEDQVRNIVRRSLTQQGYNVLEASNGSAALSLFGENPKIRMVVTDLVMPGIHGRELAKALRTQRPDLPILFVSGYPAEQMMDNLGPHDGFLAKPFSLDNLAAQLGAML